MVVCERACAKHGARVREFAEPQFGRPARVVGPTGGSLGGRNQGGLYDAWVAKFSALGVARWKRQLGTSQYDSASGVAATDNGRVYISGSTAGALGGTNKGAYDAYVHA